MTPDPPNQTVNEYRICGDDAKRGRWDGAWHSEPTAGLMRDVMYDVREIAKRNDRVWIERRTVTYGPISVEEVPDAR